MADTANFPWAFRIAWSSAATEMKHRYGNISRVRKIVRGTFPGVEAKPFARTRTIAGAKRIPATVIAETISVSAERIRAAKTRASSGEPCFRFSA